MPISGMAATQKDLKRIGLVLLERELQPDSLKYGSSWSITDGRPRDERGTRRRSPARPAPAARPQAALPTPDARPAPSRRPRRSPARAPAAAPPSARAGVR